MRKKAVIAVILIGILWLLIPFAFPQEVTASAPKSVTITLDWQTVTGPVLSGLYAGLIALLVALVPKLYAKIPRPFLPLAAAVLAQVATWAGSYTGGTGTLKGMGLAFVALVFRSVYKHFAVPKAQPVIEKVREVIVETIPAELPKIDNEAIVKEVLNRVVSAIGKTPAAADSVVVDLGLAGKTKP